MRSIIAYLVYPAVNVDISDNFKSLKTPCAIIASKSFTSHAFWPSSNWLLAYATKARF
jgi:hypothetical protein